MFFYFRNMVGHGMALLAGSSHLKLHVFVRLVAVGIIAFGLTVPQAQALPVDLITDGTFQNTSATQDTYLCAVPSPGGTSNCTSALTNWTTTCPTFGCQGTNAPSTLLFGTDIAAIKSGGKVVISQFNFGYSPGIGLYWNNVLGSTLASPGGGNVVAIDGDSNHTSTLSQTINGLNPGSIYDLSFYQAAAEEYSFYGATTERWRVSLGSSTATSPLMTTAAQSSVGWSLVSLQFVATAASEV